MRLDPQGCMKVKKRCKDYGIGQLNYKIWGKHLKLSRVRLLTDVDYAVESSVKVYMYYKTRYAKKELDWFTRYHSGTPKLRYRYLKYLNRGFKKINLYLGAYNDAKEELSSRDM